jgi:hypothetical protein
MENGEGDKEDIRIGTTHGTKIQGMAQNMVVHGHEASTVYEERFNNLLSFYIKCHATCSVFGTG